MDEEPGEPLEGQQLASLAFSTFWTWQPPPRVGPRADEKHLTDSPPSQGTESTGLADLPLTGAQAPPHFLPGVARLHLSLLPVLGVGFSGGLGFLGAGTGRGGATLLPQG